MLILRTHDEMVDSSEERSAPLGPIAIEEDRLA